MAESASTSTGSGPGRVLVAVYAVFALAATGRSTVQLATQADEALAPYLLSAAAALVYVAATLGLARAGPGWRRTAWLACGIELVGVLTVGTATLAEPGWFRDGTVWSGYGAGYGYVPLVLPFAGLGWLVLTGRTDLRRARTAGQKGL